MCTAGGSSNGRTSGFGPDDLGSSPSPPAVRKNLKIDLRCLVRHPRTAVFYDSRTCHENRIVSDNQLVNW